MFKKYDSYIVGYYGMRNSGDDALMYAASYGAETHLNCENNIVGLFGEHQRQTNTSHQLLLKYSQQFSGQNRLLQYKTAIQSKRIIFGGGSVLHSESDINLKRHLMALSSKKNSLAVGVGLGPFTNVKAERACSKFLNECGFVGVRDNESLLIANEIAPNANVQKTFDLAPLLLKSEKVQKVIKSNKPRRGIALSLCSVAINPMGDVNEKDEKNRIDQLVAMITGIYDKTGESITLLEFNGHKNLGDWFINQQVMIKLPRNIPVTVKAYQPNPISLIEDLACYKAVISMRLHGSILAYLTNTPVISINYHRKCQGWCDDIGMNRAYQVKLQELNINHVISQIASGIEKGFSLPDLKPQSAYQQSLANWSTCYE